jgi:hypothetical protein
MGDCVNVKPKDKLGKTKNATALDSETDEPDAGGIKVGGDVEASADMVCNVVTDEMVDINKIRFNKKFQAQILSSCPIVPKYHATFGEGTDR